MTIPRVVACDVLGDESVIYLQKEDGSIASIRRRFRPYLLTPNDGNPLSLTLKGKNYYNSLTFFENKAKFWESYRKACDKFAIHDDRQALFTIGKLNLFHDTRFDEISVLGFDCETSGLRLDDKAELFLITNTFRKAQVTSKKTFFYKDFTDQGHMLRAWVDWVREMDPTIILGFNCLKFDFPYILHIANKFGVQLNLGRDGSQLKTEFPKQFRTDGNHSIEYEDVSIHGRHVIDLWLLAMKFDTGRRFENYQLKYLVKTLGLMDENRALYDASIISENIHIDSELKKIIAYAEDDASDLIKLWDRMGEPFFELAKAVPKSLQSVVYSGIGSIWNSMMVREYLNMGHSIPKATEITASYEGGLSIGNAGLYHHLLRFDVASLYPSIILLYGIYEETKDPHRKFLTLIEEFTSKRLRQKALDQETGKAQHQAASESLKLIINGAYGALAAMANAFNSPQKAALITEKAREILRTAIGFVSDQGFVLAHADTDSITFCKKDQTPFSESERMAILKNLNSLFPSRIRWEPEKPIEKMLVVTKRAYAMQFEDGALVIKGNSLRGNQRPRAFKECVQLLVKSRFEGNEEAAKDLKASYLNEIETLTDISRFAFRKRITSAVVSSERTFEKKLRLALFGSNYVHDDRVHFYFCKNQSIKLAQNWNGDHCKKRLLQQLKQSMEIVLGKGTYERL